MKTDVRKFENIHQLGGIRTGTLDPHGARVAFVDTGAGLRFTVALDRGGDIVDASYNQFGLAYLTPNGLLPPSAAYSVGNEWIAGWAGGLVTTCGPQFIGGARVEDGAQTSLHGTYSQQTATVETLRNPDSNRDRFDMEIGLVVRDARVFGPSYEIRRTIRCVLGEPAIVIEDEVTNRGDTRVPHHWLYHCNLGYPLLDRGARFIYRGPAEYWVMPPPPGEDIVQPLGAAAMNRLKRVPDPLPEHAGSAERGLIVEPPADRAGLAHIGIINPALKLGLEISYPAKALPRFANWHHFGPRGCYASALEPFSGSLLGSARDKHPRARQFLEPGESRRYRLQLRVLSGAKQLKELAAHDGPMAPAR
ncbi:MAG: DUF4432 family protein [Chthoniobacteraceae bacterium]